MKKRYNMGFSAGALLFKESITISEQFLELQNWEAVKSKTISENLLQIRTLSGLQRIYSETVRRLSTLSEESLGLLVNSSKDTQIQIVWYSICKKYLFISEFVQEVIQSKLIRFDYLLTEDDFFIFYNKKAEIYDELNQLTELTKSKLKNNIFRMMREAGFVTKDHLINKIVIVQEVKNIIEREGLLNIRIFPSF